MEKLGIETFSLLTQIFNFLLLVFLLTKFLYTPILKKLEERRKKIEEGLMYAQKMKEEAEKSERVREEIIAKAKEEGKKLIEEAKKSAKVKEREMIAKAEKEAKGLLEKAKEEIELERRKMQKELRQQIVDLVFRTSQAVLADVLDLKLQHKIIEKKIQEIEKMVK